MDTRVRDYRTGELTEHRSEERRRVLKGARILFNSGYGALECIVRNQSPSGARLVFGDSAAVPNRFSLYFSDDDRCHEATVQWRNADSVGVKVA